MLTTLTQSISSLVFPQQCESCRQALPPIHRYPVCSDCEKQVRPLGAPHCPFCGRTTLEEGLRCGQCPREIFSFDRAYACAGYEGVLKNLLHAYKFGGQTALKTFFLRFMCVFIDRHLPGSAFQAVAAVPLDKERRRVRGFNQAALLAAGIASHLKIEDGSQHLSRLPSGQAQARLSREQRSANVQDRFHADKNGFFRCKNVLLVDDILTTGLTSSECARALKTAEARSVTALALARGI